MIHGAWVFLHGRRYERIPRHRSSHSFVSSFSSLLAKRRYQFQPSVRVCELGQKMIIDISEHQGSALTSYKAPELAGTHRAGQLTLTHLLMLIYHQPPSHATRTHLG
jgi:hypothetical protein